MGVPGILVDAVTSEWPWLFLPVGLRLPSYAQGLPCCQKEEGGWRHSSNHFGRRLRACLRGLRVEPCDPSCNIMRYGYSPTAQAGSTDLQQESEVSQVSDGQATRYILEPRWDTMLSCSLPLCWPTSTSSQGLGFLGGSYYTTLSCHTLQD